MIHLEKQRNGSKPKIDLCVYKDWDVQYDNNSIYLIVSGELENYAATVTLPAIRRFR